VRGRGSLYAHSGSAGAVRARVWGRASRGGAQALCPDVAGTTAGAAVGGRTRTGTAQGAGGHPRAPVTGDGREHPRAHSRAAPDLMAGGFTVERRLDTGPAGAVGPAARIRASDGAGHVSTSGLAQRGTSAAAGTL